MSPAAQAFENIVEAEGWSEATVNLLFRAYILEDEGKANDFLSFLSEVTLQQENAG